LALTVAANVIRRVVVALLLTLTACAQLTAEKRSAPDKGDSRAQLSIGYSLLYHEADGIPKLKWLFMFKEKTSEMSQLTDELVTYYQRLAEEMERLSKLYPAMHIDVEAMSPIESEERKAIGADEAKDMAPLAGKSGIGFEREALLMFYNALNEQRHLTEVMVRLESDPGLKKFLESTQAQLDERYKKVGTLLDRRYFSH
jgi:hypothetical protein